MGLGGSDLKPRSAGVLFGTDLCLEEVCMYHLPLIWSEQNSQKGQCKKIYGKAF